MKIFFLLIDGVGDCQNKELDGKTPLEAANHPTLDKLARNGYTGLYDPVSPGLACGTDTAHFSIHGYDPLVYYKGRGALEAMGQGMELGPTDVAFKSNFAVIDDKTNIVTSRRADREFTKEGPILCQALDGLKIPGFEGAYIRVRYATEHRCTVALTSPHLTDAVTGTDPLVDEKPLCVSRPLDPENEDAVYTAKLINATSDAIREVLRTHPLNIEREKEGKPAANLVLLRGPSSAGVIPKYIDKNGMSEEAIVPTGIVRGVMTQLGIKLDDLPIGATGDEHSDLKNKIFESAKHAAEPGSSDIIFCHVKAADDAGHDGRPKDKAKHIEQCDLGLSNAVQVLSKIPGGCCVVVTGDHSTPCNFFDHSDEPVPFLISAIGYDKDSLFKEAPNNSSQRFTEAECAKGQLGRFRGEHIVHILKHLNKL